MKLKTLDIIGTINGGKECALVANKDIFLVKGTEDEVLDYRKAILQAHTVNYRVPKMWDRSWNATDGPIWTPDASEDSDIKCWLIPENIETNGGGTVVRSWPCAVNDIRWGADGSTERPAADGGTPGVMNGFGACNFNGTTDCLFVQESSFATTGDWLVWIVIDAAPSDDSSQILMQLGGEAAFTTNTYTMLAIEGTNTDTIYHYVGATAHIAQSGSFIDGGKQIILAGVQGGAPIARTNGAAHTLSSNWTDINLGADHDWMLGAAWTATTGAESLHYSGDIFEWGYMTEKTSKDLSNDITKVEGYLSQKYGIALASGHAYETHPPRASVLT